MRLTTHPRPEPPAPADPALRQAAPLPDTGEPPNEPAGRPAAALPMPPSPRSTPATGRSVRLYALAQWFQLPITRDQHAFISSALHPPRPEDIW